MPGAPGSSVSAGTCGTTGTARSAPPAAASCAGTGARHGWMEAPPLPLSVPPCLPLFPWASWILGGLGSTRWRGEA